MSGYQVVPFPGIRHANTDFLRLGHQKHIIHLLTEVDVTGPRQFLREYKARTGESVSFTAFIIRCLARAVDENRDVHAYRQGRNKLVIFDEVDVTAPVQGEASGLAFANPHIIRAANRKTIREIHGEIRGAQAAEKAKAREIKGLPWYLSWGLATPGFVRGWLWRAMLGSPHRLKKIQGTAAVTAVGMFGSGGGWGIPITNYTLCLVTGGIARKPGVVDGRIEPREYLSLTISVDHDVVDGARAAVFSSRLKELIESGFGLDSL